MVFHLAIGLSIRITRAAIENTLSNKSVHLLTLSEYKNPIAVVIVRKMIHKTKNLDKRH